MRRIFGFVCFLALLWGSCAIYWSNLPWANARLVLAIVFFLFGAWALWVSRKPRSKGIFAIGFAGVFIWFLTISPSHYRNWRPEVAVMPRAIVDGDRITFTGVRDFEFQSRHDFVERRETREVLLSDLVGADLLLSFWATGPVGHTFISFIFENSPPLTISIETRPEVGEGFKPIASMFKQLELIYLVGTEEDLIGHRVLHRDEEMYLFRLKATPESIRELFMVYVDRINQLADTPEWYHLLVNSCTINIIRYANAIGRPGGFNIRHLLNGFISGYLYNTGFVDTSLPYDEFRARSNISDAVRNAYGRPGFSDLIRQGVPGISASNLDGNKVIDMHNSRNSLDWAGEYSGVLACSDCAGIETTLTLRSDDTYTLNTRALEREEQSVITQGQIIWADTGNALSLNFRDTNRQFAVNEGRLVLLNQDGSRPDPISEQHILNQSNNAQPQARNISQLLTEHSWTVESAQDQKGDKILPLLPTQENNFVFSFSEGTFGVRGGCNSMRGGYSLQSSMAGGKSGTLVFQPAASTLMGCESDAQEADSLLSAFLAEQLQFVIVPGGQPRVTLTSTDGRVLTLIGTPTPESLYGAPTTIFLEVAPHLVSCKPGATEEVQCLFVRDRIFDAQGLKVETQSPWRPLLSGIEGFNHTEGQRSVVRVKRYQQQGECSRDSEDQCTVLLVLDFIVETESSELVPQVLEQRP
jgi:heat shock protein HslJ